MGIFCLLSLQTYLIIRNNMSKNVAIKPIRLFVIEQKIKK